MVFLTGDNVAKRSMQREQAIVKIKREYTEQYLMKIKKWLESGWRKWNNGIEF